MPQQRGYATEQSTSSSPSSSQSYPPPGFNAEQAKKPLPLDQAQSAQPVAQPPKQQTTETTTLAKSAGATKSVTTEESKSLSEEKKDGKKLTIGQKIKKEVQHYWDGTKLLATEVKISSRLALKMAAGYELSRREHRQVCVKMSLHLGSEITNIAPLVPASTYGEGSGAVGPILGFHYCSLC